MENDKARLGFLSAVLGLNPKDIRETSILNANLRREHEDEKQGILDVHILMDNDTEVDVEINLAYMAQRVDRTLFYMAKMIGGQLHSGDQCKKMRKCSISILDFKLFKAKKEYYSCFYIREGTQHFIYIAKAAFHVIELPQLPELTPEQIENRTGPSMLLLCL